MASNFEEDMDFQPSQDMFADCDPESATSNPKLFLTYGEIHEFRKKHLKKNEKGMTKKFAERILFETGLSMVDTNSDDPAIQEDLFRAKTDVHNRHVGFVAKFKTYNYAWKDDFKKDDVFLRLGDYPSLINPSIDEFMDMGDGSFKGSLTQASAVSTASAKSLLEELHPAPVEVKRRKEFDAYTNKWQREVTQELFDNFCDSAAKIGLSKKRLAGFIGHRALYHEDRKAAMAFKRIGMGQDGEISLDKATHIKYFCNLSDRAYTNLRYQLGGHCDLPAVNRVQTHATSLLPPLNIYDKIPFGVCASFKDVVTCTLKRLPDHIRHLCLTLSNGEYSLTVRFTSGIDGSGQHR